jgi:ubiquinone biosynthesis protein
VAAPAEVVAVDYGIVGRLGPGERRYLAEILYGFLNRDYARVARIHFDAGYVPAHQDVDAFAQALRAVGEPVFGRDAREVSMGRLLAQLFEITALFDMALRPELVLLQKTMVTVEGVARRIDPAHDLWAAADPVVRRWIGRELSPAAKVRDFADEALRALKALARLAEAPPPAAVVVEQRQHTWPLLWFLVGAATAGAAFVTGLLLAR